MVATIRIFNSYSVLSLSVRFICDWWNQGLEHRGDFFRRVLCVGFFCGDPLIWAVRRNLWRLKTEAVSLEGMRRGVLEGVLGVCG